MKIENSWESIAPKIIKAELIKRGLTYQHLAVKLGEIGVRETETNIKGKLARGSFNVVFFLQVLHALGIQNLQLDSSLFEGLKEK